MPDFLSHPGWEGIGALIALLALLAQLWGEGTRQGTRLSQQLGRALTGTIAVAVVEVLLGPLFAAAVSPLDQAEFVMLLVLGGMVLLAGAMGGSAGSAARGALSAAVIVPIVYAVFTAINFLNESRGRPIPAHEFKELYVGLLITAGFAAVGGAIGGATVAWRMRGVRSR